MMQHDQQQNGSQRIGKTANWFMLVCRALAVTVEVFLHRPATFGERYLGVQVPMAMAILMCFPILLPAHDPTPLMVYFGAFLVMCAVIRGASVKRRLRGEPQPHSYYSGEPRVMRRKRGTSEIRVKAVQEPLVVWIAAFCMQSFSEVLALYLVAAGAGLLICVNAARTQERSRALDTNDALIDQRRVAEQWRGMRRDK